MSSAVSVIHRRSCEGRYVNFTLPSHPGAGSHTITPQIQAIKDDLKDKNAPFGVDLLLPQVGGSARKTNVRFMCSDFSPPQY